MSGEGVGVKGMYSLQQELSGREIAHIKEKLAENARVINAGLEHYLSTPGGEYAGSGYAGLTEAMRYGALSGGKRIRGFLTRECFEAFGGDCGGEVILPVACAVEMIHAYSLIHDDLPCMDDDDTRRGQPACHIKFGEAAALLAGDALLALAFNIIADAEKISPENKVSIISELSRAAGYSGMVGGQMMDLDYAADTGAGSMSREANIVRLIKLQTLKTGALIIAAARAGCIAAGAAADGVPVDLIGGYAKNVGLAFQVIDDSFDGDGFAAVLGDKASVVEYARGLTLEALLKLEKLKELNELKELKELRELKESNEITGVNVKTLETAAKYLLYREY